MTFSGIARATAAIVLGAMMAACGGGGSGPAAPTTPPVVTPPVVPPPVVVPPPLQYPIPSGLWSAPSGATPASGNYVYLQSDSGDYIGGGRTYSYTNADTLITPSNSGLTIDVGVQGNQGWNGTFLLPSAARTLQAGYFKDLTRTPFADSAVGGVEWSGEGRGCNAIKGWVVIDKVELSNGVMTALDLRFEQHCEGGSSALHGQVHWTKADADSGQIAGPEAIPASLWRAAAGAVPASGNYLYLESSAGDFIGEGRTYTYTQASAAITPTSSGAYLGISISGDQNWSGDFQGIRAMSRLTVGYYAGLSRYPFNNPVLGGLSWSGEGRGCNRLSGWFVIDSISYSGNTLTAVDLRFEQRCEGGAPLHGQLHWTSSDTSTPAGPQLPVPAGLWQPNQASLPLAGNYVLLVSDSGDYIGGGRTELLTDSNATLAVSTDLTAALHISVGGWSGEFFGMTGLSQLLPGYYGNLQRYPFHNAARGGLSWSGNGRGCNTLTGWFVVDKATYALGRLTAIDLRFEQHCEGGTSAQRGVIHWAK
jgi:hypothetical protein